MALQGKIHEQFCIVRHRYILSKLRLGRLKFVEAAFFKYRVPSCPFNDIPVAEIDLNEDYTLTKVVEGGSSIGFMLVNLAGHLAYHPWQINYNRRLPEFNIENLILIHHPVDSFFLLFPLVILTIDYTQKQYTDETFTIKEGVFSDALRKGYDVLTTHQLASAGKCTIFGRSK